MNFQNTKSLVVYFSRQGKNIIGSGDIIDLPVGNAEVVAQMIQEATGSDSFRIEAVNPYPEDYRETYRCRGGSLQSMTHWQEI